MKIDKISLLATVDVRTLLREMEMGLAEEGLTLGYLPRLKKNSRLTIGQTLRDRIPNRYALYYGEIDDICVSVVARLGSQVVVTKNVPRSATGPDFKKIFAGAHHRYAELEEVTLRVCPLPVKRRILHMTWKSTEERSLFEKRLWASGVRPLCIRRDGGQSLVVELAGRGDLVRAAKECLKRLVVETGGDSK